MTYTEFEIRFLLAIMAGADESERGQVEVTAIAEEVYPDAPESWVTMAVREFEVNEFVYNVSRPLMLWSIVLMVTAKGRKHAGP